MLDKVDPKTKLDLQEKKAFGTLMKAQHRKGLKSFDEKQKHAQP